MTRRTSIVAALIAVSGGLAQAQDGAPSDVFVQENEGALSTLGASPSPTELAAMQLGALRRLEDAAPMAAAMLCDRHPVLCYAPRAENYELISDAARLAGRDEAGRRAVMASVDGASGAESARYELRKSFVANGVELCRIGDVAGTCARAVCLIDKHALAAEVDRTQVCDTMRRGLSVRGNFDGDPFVDAALGDFYRGYCVAAQRRSHCD